MWFMAARSGVVNFGGKPPKYVVHFLLSTESYTTSQQDWEAPHRPSRVRASRRRFGRKTPKVNNTFTAFNYHNNHQGNTCWNQIDNHNNNNNLDHQIQSLQEDSGFPQTSLQQFKLYFLNKNASKPNPNPPPQPEDPDEIFKKMKATGFKPYMVSMLRALSKDGLVQDAMDLFVLMRHKGTIPPLVIYTAVVEAFCNAHQFDDAKRIFAKMQNNGVTPNAFTYTVFIQGLCEGRHFQDALDFSLEMLEAGHSPNVPTFTNLIHGFCNEKGLEEAESVVRRMRQKGFFINDKALQHHLNNNGPFSPLLLEAIFGKTKPRKLHSSFSLSVSYAPIFWLIWQNSKWRMVALNVPFVF